MLLPEVRNTKMAAAKTQTIHILTWKEMTLNGSLHRLLGPKVDESFPVTF
jgi:hypothetical protein